ncbi:MAG: LysR family transcriptional regulator [Deltaproteobacteria bacterium]|nr:LysR family transcriptional regulator [Deltaproteobacteria bacterium]
MNLRDLEYLVAISRLGSMARASVYCSVSQSTLSIQIKKLEEELGAALFERRSRRVTPTRTGARVIERCERILHEVRGIREIAKSESDPLSGDLRLGAFPTLAPYWFPRIIPLVKERFPKLRLQLVEEKTGQLLEGLAAGAIDCAVLAMPVEQRGFEHRRLFAEPFYLAVPRDHALARKRGGKVDTARLSGENLLLLEEGHCMRGQALQFCASRGISSEGSYMASSLETLRNMVAAGQGLTLIPKIAASPAAATGIRYLSFSDSQPRREIGLFWRTSTSRRELFVGLAKAMADRRIYS